MLTALPLNRCRGNGPMKWMYLPLLLLLLGCQSTVQAPIVAQIPAQTEPTLTLMATAVLPSPVAPTETAARAATTAPPPTETALPPTFTPAAAATQTATAVPAPTETPTPEPALACPDPPPLKPVYDRYFLSPDGWPQPDAAASEPHFWLAKPLPGGGRLLFNQTYPYGYDGNGRYLLHNGVDTAEVLGTPVLAVADGTVIVAQADADAWFGWRCDWYGHLVIIELDETWRGRPLYVLYGHVLNINVAVGDRVQRGDPVAEIGVGGAAVAPHLHFELRVGANRFDSTRNPMLWFDPGPTRGVIAGRLVDPQGRPWQGVTVTLIPQETDPEFINTWTYMDDPLHLINPDEGLAENFVFADVKPGAYELYVKLQGVEYRQSVTVTAGALTQVELVTEPYKTPTPTSETAVPPTEDEN